MIPKNECSATFRLKEINTPLILQIPPLILSSFSLPIPTLSLITSTQQTTSPYPPHTVPIRNIRNPPKPSLFPPTQPKHKQRHPTTAFNSRDTANPTPLLSHPQVQKQINRYPKIARIERVQGSI